MCEWYKKKFNTRNRWNGEGGDNDGVRLDGKIMLKLYSHMKMAVVC